MAKNRKTQSGAVWIVPVFKAGLLCLLLGGSSVGYVLQKNQIFDLGQQINRREAIWEKLKRENKMKASQLSDLQLPAKVAERVKQQKLGLINPPASAIIWLEEPIFLDQSANPPTSALIVMRNNNKNVARPETP
jgi:hypothetical protein